MIFINGKIYHTTIDAAMALGVSSKTVREYIKRGILPNPPVIRHGLREIKYFTEEYLEEAKKRVREQKQDPYRTRERNGLG